MTEALVSEILAALQGHLIVIRKLEHGWSFLFGDECALNVSAPWRVVNSSGIAFASSDDRQQFGLSKPIDGEALANALLAGARVTLLKVDDKTADLHINLKGEIRIDLFNHSSGYEGWQASSRTHNEDVCVIGLGGGNLAISRTPLR